MNSQSARIAWLASIVYGVAIVISIFVGGLIWVIIIGAVLLGLLRTATHQFTRDPGAGRQRNRNRNRNRNRS